MFCTGSCLCRYALAAPANLKEAKPKAGSAEATRNSFQRGSMTGDEAWKPNRKLMIARPFSLLNPPWTDDSATKINRGERSANGTQARASGNRFAPGIGSKPAKGENPMSAVGRIADRAPSPDGGPELRVRRRTNGMFASATRIRSRAADATSAPPQHQEPAAPLRRIFTDQVTRGSHASSGTSPG
jgi:hypothetical protein